MGVAAILMLALAVDGPSTPDLSDAQLAARAEAAFQEGLRLRADGESGQKEFQTVAVNYEELRQRGVANPDLDRNLGHAYVLADDLPHAILSLRRGLRVAPHDSGLRDSLGAARALVIYQADHPLGRPVTEPRPLLSSQWLFLADLFAYGGLCVCGTRWLMTRRGLLMLSAAFCLVIDFTLTWSLVAAERRRAAEMEQTLVVINEDGVLLRKGDNLAYTARYETPVNRGVEARLVYQRDKWVQIELTGGEIGWVPAAFVLFDVPQKDNHESTKEQKHEKAEGTFAILRKMLVSCFRSFVLS